MEESSSSSSSSAPQPKPQIVLQKPPGYRDAKPSAAKPPRPPRSRKPVLPPSFQPPKSKRRTFCRICCCTFCIVIIILLLIITIAGALFYIIYKPSIPEFHLGSFRVTKANVTNGFLDADISTRIQVKNRNGKITWRFEQSSVRVWADNGDLNLGSTKVAGFVVKEREMNYEFKAETSVRKEALDARQRRRLKGMLDSKALIPSVEIKTRTALISTVDGWKSIMFGITVVCSKDVTIRQIENGAMPPCSLTFFK